MRKQNHKVKEVRFNNPRLSGLGIEIIRLSALRGRMGRELEVAERPDFYLVVLARSGAGWHMVDFVKYSLKAGDVMLVRPGQVQQWCLDGNLQGELVLISPEVLTPYAAPSEEEIRALGLDDWPTRFRPQSSSFAQAVASLGRLRTEIDVFNGGVTSASIVRHELMAMLLRLSRQQAAPMNSVALREVRIHRTLVRELEKQLHTRLSVTQLAARLGYSESSVSRACVAVTGLTAKQVVDQRVALEAKRLLVHTQSSTAAISRQLGFSEPTNFGKFFRRVALIAPARFREMHSGH